jgi:hypothetical protein
VNHLLDVLRVAHLRGDLTMLFKVHKMLAIVWDD